MKQKILIRKVKESNTTNTMIPQIEEKSCCNIEDVIDLVVYQERIIKYLSSANVDKTLEFHNQIRTLDKIRNENFVEIFPEWAEVVMYNE
jgi:hypothetical protein